MRKLRHSALARRFGRSDHVGCCPILAYSVNTGHSRKSHKVFSAKPRRASRQRRLFCGSTGRYSGTSGCRLRCGPRPDTRTLRPPALQSRRPGLTHKARPVRYVRAFYDRRSRCTGSANSQPANQRMGLVGTEVPCSHTERTIHLPTRKG
jgi:hypothetical protein